MEGDLNGFILPSEEVRDNANPGPAVQVWEDTVKIYHNFIGDGYGDRQKQWGCFDVQITHGYVRGGAEQGKLNGLLCGGVRPVPPGVPYGTRQCSRPALNRFRNAFAQHIYDAQTSSVVKILCLSLFGLKYT